MLGALDEESLEKEAKKRYQDALYHTLLLFSQAKASLVQTTFAVLYCALMQEKYIQSIPPAKSKNGIGQDELFQVAVEGCQDRFSQSMAMQLSVNARLVFSESWGSGVLAFHYASILTLLFAMKEQVFVSPDSSVRVLPLSASMHDLFMQEADVLFLPPGSAERSSCKAYFLNELDIYLNKNSQQLGDLPSGPLSQLNKKQLACQRKVELAQNQWAIQHKNPDALKKERDRVYWNRALKITAGLLLGAAAYFLSPVIVPLLGAVLGGLALAGIGVGIALAVYGFVSFIQRGSQKWSEKHRGAFLFLPSQSDPASPVSVGSQSNQGSASTAGFTARAAHAGFSGQSVHNNSSKENPFSPVGPGVLHFSSPSGLP